MPKPWEPGGSEADWVGVVPQELEFWLNGREVHIRPVLDPSFGLMIPHEWVRANLPPWLWTQPRPATFVSDGRPGRPSIVDTLRVIGFWHASELDTVEVALPLSPAAVDSVTGYRLPSEMGSSLGERVARGQTEHVAMLDNVIDIDLSEGDPPPMTEAELLAVESYNRELSAGEVAQLHERGPLSTPGGRILHIFQVAQLHDALSVPALRSRLRAWGWVADTDRVDQTVAELVEAGHLVAEGDGWRLLDGMILRVFGWLPNEELSFGTISEHLREDGWEGQPGAIATAIGRLVGSGQLVAGSPGVWRFPEDGSVHFNSESLEERIEQVFQALPDGGPITTALVHGLLRTRGFNHPAEDVARVVDRMVEFGQLMSVEGGYQLPRPEGPRPEEPPGDPMDIRILEVLRRRSLAGLDESLLASEIWEELVRLGWAHPNSGVSDVVPILREMASRGQLDRSSDGGWRTRPTYLSLYSSTVRVSDHFEALFSGVAPEGPLTFSARVERALSGAGWVPMGILHDRLMEGGWVPFEGHLSFDVHVASVPGVESRGYAPHIEFRLRPSFDPAMRKVAGTPLADRIIALFNNDLSVVHTAVVLQNRVGADSPVKASILQETLLELVRGGRLYYLHNQGSNGYRLVRREGVEAPSVWDRLKGDDEL